MINEKMELFINEMPANILPADGVANYFGKVLTQKSSQDYLDKLLRHIEWKND